MLDIIKALAHQNRLRILNLLSQQELCVCEIQHIMQVNQSNASRHLSKLKAANIIVGEHQAQWVYYYIENTTLEDHPFLELVIEEEVKKLEICKKDNQRLREYQASSFSCNDLSYQK